MENGNGFSGPGNMPALQDIVNSSREKIWHPFFHKLQYEDGPALLAAFGQRAYVEFFTTLPADMNLCNLHSAGQLPFAYGLDGWALDINVDDRFYDDPHYYQVNKIMREHGRFEVRCRDNNEVFNAPASLVPPATGYGTSMATTQTASQSAHYQSGVPHLRNYWRPGGPDPAMGIMLERKENIVARFHLDAYGLAFLTMAFGGESPNYTLSDQGAQLEARLFGYGFRKMG